MMDGAMAMAMNTRNYLKHVYMDDPNSIFLRLSTMAERLDDVTDRIDYNTHARSNVDHDYVSWDVPAEEVGRIFMPAAGRVVGLVADADDTLRGVRVRPSKGMLFSPVTGRITAQLPTLNAVGLTTFDGVQMLVTVGEHPERYRGDAFRQLAWQNDSVHLGDPLLTWDRSRLVEEGEGDEITLVVMNTNEFEVSVPQGRLPRRRLRPGAPILQVEPKTKAWLV